MNEHNENLSLDVGDLSDPVYPSTAADGPIFAIILVIAVIAVE